ncbi:SNF2 family N-terminal domain-containing protein [Triangularia verruculosa]|uniref:SNF2 family N-terminal domain-containing protein n=1 Tax=Triangularia verruculosa TaxID=2587418 RepID=A0AAN6X5K3_9PEZI|nr:SNF2 family N-terminal domain-containing protein [Triangularia verruculosa]
MGKRCIPTGAISPMKRSKLTERTEKPLEPNALEVIDIPSSEPSPTLAPSYHVESPQNCDVRCIEGNGQILNSTAISAENSAGLPYQVCFGLLLMEATYTQAGREPVLEPGPVQINFLQNVLNLRYGNTGTFAGMLVSEPLARLTKTYKVTLAASIGTENVRRSSRMGTSRLGFDGVRMRPLRIIVYGFLSEMDDVANLLAKGGLFLQYPEESEYDRRVKYLNPMYLLPPGKEMPRIPSPSTAGSSRNKDTSVDQEELGEVERSRMLRIFDDASGPTESSMLGLTQSTRIISTLKDHQLEAVAMMIEKEHGTLDGKTRFPSLWEPSIEKGETVYRHVVTKAVQNTPLPNLQGGILADEMGLGKTLSILALVCHHLDALADIPSLQPTHWSKATLIVTPKSTIYGWQQQIKTHIRPDGLRSFVYHGSTQNNVVNELHNFDVVLTTYDKLRSDWASSGPLYTRAWARIVLDEAHKIRNPASQIFRATCEAPARKRWCLTGTPIQNRLSDFGSLLAFIGVPPFVTQTQFRFWISAPLLAHRQYSLLMLRKLVRATCLRRTKAHPHIESKLVLPVKRERVELVELGKAEKEVYDFFKRRFYLLAKDAGDEQHSAAGSKDGSSKGVVAKRPKKKNISEKVRRKGAGNIIILLSILRQICNHGEALLPQAALEIWRNRDAGIFSWDVLEKAVETGRSCSVCGEGVESGEDGEKCEADVTVEFPCRKHVACGTCATMATDDAALKCSKCPATENGLSTSTMPSCIGSAYSPSSKVSALLRNILTTLKGRDLVSGNGAPIKSVIFSQWTGMLDLISQGLDMQLSSLGLSSTRIDGQSSLQHRRITLEKFNSDKGCVVMLATIGAVGEGIDLSVASEVHIVEPHWNPMAEAQAVDRVHRISQTRDVNIIRYCVNGSIEEYIQWTQAKKVRMIRESLSAERQSDGKQAEESLVEERWEKLLTFLI